MDESLLQDDVPVVMIAKAQPESGKAETDTKFQFGPYCNDGIDSVRPALTSVLKV